MFSLPPSSPGPSRSSSDATDDQQQRGSAEYPPSVYCDCATMQCRELRFRLSISLCTGHLMKLLKLIILAVIGGLVLAFEGGAQAFDA